MYDYGYHNKQMQEDISPQALERRNGSDRRKAPACGFTYISSVGWICRREQFRRKDDPEVFANCEL
jgi:hypothetical protein